MVATVETVEQVREVAEGKYKYGFVTDIETDTAPKGLNEDIVRFISAKKEEPEWLLEWRLKAFRLWQTLPEPEWAKVNFPPIDYQDAYYYSAPKSPEDAPKSLDEVDPKLLETYEKLGIPLSEQKVLAGVAVDAVFDSVSVATTFKKNLEEVGVIFCSISEAIKNHPDLVRKYLGSVVPAGDNKHACLNSAVFTDGSFVYIPKGVRCPMELSTYFRINAANTGQFERTLIIADEGSYVSYLEGCTAPMRDENQLHAAIVELIALDDAEIKYSTVQNWYPGDENGVGGIYNFVTKRGACRGKEFQNLLDPGGDRLGHHLEVPELHPAGRQFGGRILFHRHHQQSAAGRYRHQDDPPGQEHPLAHHRQGHLRRQIQQHLPRTGAHGTAGRGRAQLHAVRLALDRRPVRRPHGALHRKQKPRRPSWSTRPPPRASARTSFSTAASAACRRKPRWPWW